MNKKKLKLIVEPDPVLRSLHTLTHFTFTTFLGGRSSSVNRDGSETEAQGVIE